MKNNQKTAAIVLAASMMLLSAPSVLADDYSDFGYWNFQLDEKNQLSIHFKRYDTYLEKRKEGDVPVGQIDHKAFSYFKSDKRAVFTTQDAQGFLYGKDGAVFDSFPMAVRLDVDFNGFDNRGTPQIYGEAKATGITEAAVNANDYTIGNLSMEETTLNRDGTFSGETTFSFVNIKGVNGQDGRPVMNIGNLAGEYDGRFAENSEIVRGVGDASGEDYSFEMVYIARFDLEESEKRNCLPVSGGGQCSGNPGNDPRAPTLLPIIEPSIPE